LQRIFKNTKERRHHIETREDHERTPMSAEENNEELMNEEQQNENTRDRDGEAVASKLSKELSNWRRRRTSGRPHRFDSGNGGGSFQADAARTIKVRGHETLVIRKPKLNSKPSLTPGQNR
jgi:hypothetical protein